MLPGVLELDDKHAPPKQLFLDVLNDRVDGKPYSQFKGSGPSKARQMAWCLSEAARCDLRQKLLRATVVALHQDARKGLLLVRVSACCQKTLEVTSAVLGVLRDFGTTATDILDATVQIMQEALAPDPRKDDGIDAPSVVWPKVEVYDADGASDEQLSGRMLAGHARHPGRGRLTLAPNLRLVVRDRTHAATRIIKNPWAASRELTLAFQWFRQFAKLLFHSPDLTSRFRQMIQR